ncbi:unnamed protein product [marine sediment metagenome]|uniref:Uncharacterized protein n=1 Tax=marine sediment metagenome TaxID=412755 RepID=X0UJJ0_9ZZZZ
MDIWTNISFGKRWCGDDGTHHSEAAVQQEVHITSIGVGANARNLKYEFMKAVSEAYDRCIELEELIDKHGT